MKHLQEREKRKCSPTLTVGRSTVRKTESKGMGHKQHVIVTNTVSHVVTADSSHVAIRVYWN